MASREKDLARNTLILTIGKISTQAITFFLLPLYTAYLSREDYGVVDLIATVVSLLFPILNMQIEQAVFRYMVVNRENQTETKKIISTAFSFSFFQIVAFAILFCIIQPYVHNEYKWFLLINLVLGTLNFSLMQVMRGLGDNMGYAIAAFISSVVNIGVNLLLILVFNLGATAMLTATSIGSLVSVSFIVYRSKFWRYYSPRFFERQRLKELLSYSMPLVPNELSWWAIRASDRFVITAALGAGANGIIAVAHKFPSIYIMLYNIFGIAWTESVVLHLKEPDGEKYFSDMTNRMLRLFACASMLIVAVMPLVFGWLINDSFKEAYNLIPLYMIGSIFNVVIGLISTVYIVHKRTKVIAKTSILAATICLVTDIILVGQIGIYASPISYLLGFGVMMGYRCLDIKKYVKLEWDRHFIVLFCLMLTVTLVVYYLGIQWLNAINLILVILFVLYINKTDVLRVLNLIKLRKAKSGV